MAANQQMNKLLIFCCVFLLLPITLNAENNKQESWQFLKKGDVVDFVAPSSFYNESYRQYMVRAFASYGLIARFKYAQQDKPSFMGYSASDDKRLSQFMSAMRDPTSKAVWALRGGGGSTNLLPALAIQTPPEIIKPVIGFSDITALHLFLQTRWQWSSIHGIVGAFNYEVNKMRGVSDVNDYASLKPMIDILMGRDKILRYDGLKPINDLAKTNNDIEAMLLGGNLSLMSASLGTDYSLPQTPYILILEDIGNTSHQLERLLNQIAYSQAKDNIKAVILGDFRERKQGNSEKIEKLYQQIYRRFADRMMAPVYRFNLFGHGRWNVPIILGKKAIIRKNQYDFTLIMETQ